MDRNETLTKVGLKGCLTKQGGKMVEFVKISKKGKLIRIKNVSDAFRDKTYRWDEDE